MKIKNGIYLLSIFVIGCILIILFYAPVPGIYIEFNSGDTVFYPHSVLVENPEHYKITGKNYTVWIEKKYVKKIKKIGGNK